MGDSCKRGTGLGASAHRATVASVAAAGLVASGVVALPALTATAVAPTLTAHAPAASSSVAAMVASRKKKKPKRIAKLTGLRVSAPAHRATTLTWRPAKRACAYRIVVANNSGFHGAIFYKSRSAIPRFDVPNLQRGTRYFFQVRGLCGSRKGAPAVGSAVHNSGSVTVRAGTFNVFRGGGSLPNSEARLNLIGSVINNASFVAVGLQEVNTEMVGRIMQRVGKSYSEAPIHNSRGGNTTGGRILYQRYLVNPVGTGRLIALPARSGTRYGMLQRFKEKSTGAQFIFASAHLSNLAGRAASDERARQAKTLVRAVRGFNRWGLPTIYVGDFNSNRARKYIYDAPARVFDGYRIANSVETAPHTVRANLNSYNSLRTSPAVGGYHVDYVMTDGAAAVRWEMLARLNGSRYATPFVSDHNPVAADIQIPW
ncbi:MAG: endonuclease/exonuclease/phosphatase family protein [Candidatus Nanopelagicales bacterium]